MKSFKRNQNRFRTETGFFKFMLLAFACLFLFSSTSAYAKVPFREGRDLVIVIDPGHGGENEGTTENGFLEKEATLITAKALYDRLTQYQGITVYMTHTDDVDMSIKDRAVFAADVKADFLFSIHYNASEDHTFYGSEVWIPLGAPYHTLGYQFGSIWVEAMEEQGLVNRGVKTRRNDKGTDYYGIIRESVARDIPAVIIEHCHIDESHDAEYCDSVEDLQAFGIEDADIIAQFLGLRSTSLNKDFTAYVHDSFFLDPNEIIQAASPDTTPPQEVILSLNEIDTDRNIASFTLKATDRESALLYYTYSLDGGMHYSPLILWPDTNVMKGTSAPMVTCQVPITPGVDCNVLFKVYNAFNGNTESNPIPVLIQLPVIEEEITAPVISDPSTNSEKEPVKTTLTISEEETSKPLWASKAGIQLILTMIVLLMILLAGWYFLLSDKDNK